MSLIVNYLLILEVHHVQRKYSSSESNEDNVDMDFLLNIINSRGGGDEEAYQESDDIARLFRGNQSSRLNESNMASYFNNPNPNQESSTDGRPNINSLLSNMLNKGVGQPEKSTIDNSYFKSFAHNKINNILSNSNLSEKLLLYNLVSTNSNNVIPQENRNNFSDTLDGFMSCFNNIFDHESIEKFFQKEVVRFTIENFCKFLKGNGYMITKANEARDHKEDSEGKIDFESVNNIQPKRGKEVICPHTDKKHYAKVIF
jgi:hypothetical protein